MKQNYYPCDLRKLGQNKLNACSFTLHQPSLIMNFDHIIPIFKKQEEFIDIENLTKIFTTSYRCPEVYTAVVNECTISIKCPNMSRYWAMFFRSDNQPYYILNFLSTEAKKNFPNANIFEMDNDVIRIDLDIIPKVHIDGISVWLYPFNNLDHLLRECLPSLLTLKEMGYDFNELNFLISDLSPDILDFLIYFGVPRNRIISISHYWIHCEKLIIPCFGTFAHLHTPTKYYIEAIDTFCPDNQISFQSNLFPIKSLSNQTIGKRFYISRSKASWRRILNEDALRFEFEKRGFIMIEPGNYSKLEQLMIFREAEIIVGPHGMGIANSVFSKNLKLLVEIMNTDYNRVSYFRTAQFRHAKYGVYYTEPISLSASMNNNFGDSFIYKDKFFAFLDELIEQL